jgi:hypothetical protein
MIARISGSTGKSFSIDEFARAAKICLNGQDLSHHLVNLIETKAKNGGVFYFIKFENTRIILENGENRSFIILEVTPFLTICDLCSNRGAYFCRLG